ncbi:MAG: hypothetical protein ACR2QH_00240 [Geminicoccaceae bacterium]
MTVGTLIQALQLAKRVRAYLQSGMPITYRDLVKALRLTLPSGIHQVTEALKLLIGNDIEAGRPLIAAIAIDQVRGGLPTSGFFECAARLGRFCGDAANQRPGHSTLRLRRGRRASAMAKAA